jgi:hypothetical protein
MVRVNEGETEMIEIFGEMLKETVKEVSVSEKNHIPKFFEEMPKSNQSDNTDQLVDEKSVEDENIIISYIITRNEGLEGDVHPITGVPFEKKAIDTPDGKVEGVFPEFRSVFDAQIPENLYNETDYSQFKECNSQLYDAIENNPDLKAKFTKEQIEQIKDGINDGTAPDGYTWHHDAESGKIQLVDYDVHAKTGHTGGRTVWGGGSEYR